MSSAAFTLPSFAKVNLHLRVIGKRDDGFHELFTVFQTVSLADSLTFSLADEIELICSDPRIPAGGENIVVRAANALKERFGSSNGASINLEKHVPSPGGLGGGSSNAAVTLIGLSKLWNLGASREDLRALATDLGSDVPFFLYGGTAIGMGRGEIIEPIVDLKAKYMVIVTPNVSVSTKEAFVGLNAPNLTKAEANHILNVCRFDLESSDLLQTVLKNDFETAIFAAHPEIGRVKDALIELGAKPALMSGSGASVFGIFDNEETRQAAMKALDRQVNWRTFAVATVSRDEYREAL
jgi:4-diphosphocytidyl-2-C-methyl-D-erythritol kinase